MAATEATLAPEVQEDRKPPDSKATETEQPLKNTNANSETVNSEVVDKDGTAVNSEVVDNKETVNNDTAAAGAEDGGEAGASGETAPPQSSENTSSAEPKTSFLDSFLSKSGLGKVMGGRKKKELSTGGGGEENAADGGENNGDKGGEEAAAVTEGGTEVEALKENGEKEKEKKVEKGKQAETKSTVRDLIGKPVAKIFSHRNAEKKDVAAAEPQKQLKVRSKSLDRLEDPEALNTTADSTIEKGGAAEVAEGGVELEQISNSSKHMKHWQSFKKLMAQKTHKKSGEEEGKEEEEEEGEGCGGDSSKLNSMESGQKRWKLKRSWTFQGMKRDPSMVGISGKAKGSDKDSSDNVNMEEEAGGGGKEAKAERGTEEAKTEGGEEKVEGGKEEKGAMAGGGTMTQHASEMWTNFKKRVIPKSKRANTECTPSGEEDATATPASGEEGAADEGKEGKSAKVKRSHIGRAVSLKNFILRKGKSTSVELAEGAKEEEEEAAEGEGGAAERAEGGGTDGEAATATEETNDKAAVAVKTLAEASTTNGENGCSNGMAEENTTHNYQEEKEKMTGSSPVKKARVAKEEGSAKIINATAAVNSGELEHGERDPDQPQNSSSNIEGDTNNRQQLPLANNSCKQMKSSCPKAQLVLEVSAKEEVGGKKEAKSSQNGGCDNDNIESHDQGDRGNEEMRKRDLQEAALAIVQNVMSAATDQLERELCVNCCCYTEY